MKHCIALFRISVLVLICVLWADPQPAAADHFSPVNAIIVDTGEDQYNSDPSHCSLREAIQSANTDSAFGGCATGSGADTITLMNGIPMFYITIPGGYGTNNSEGDLNITSDLTIQGYGWQTTIIDAGCNPTPSRVFHIYHSTNQLTVAIRDMSLFYGDSRAENGGTIVNYEDLTLEGVSILDSHSDRNGGAIYSAPGDFGQSLTIRRGVFQGNSSGYAGGAIISAGEMLIEDSYLSNNDANLLSFNSNWVGGGIYSAAVPLTIRHTTLMNNQAGGSGGNLFITSTSAFPPILIEDSIITGGISGVGNGGNISVTTLSDYDLDVTIRRSEISNGQANYGYGGGIYNDVKLTLENVTISGNQAQMGGGIYTATPADGVYDLSIYKNITVTDNLDATTNVPGDGIYLLTSAPINIYNSILAMNGPDTTLGLNCDCYRTIPLSFGYNLERGNTCGFTADGDIQATDPLLAALASRHFAPRTHALLPGSPALDAGDTGSTCLTTDQRGFPRPVDGNNDGQAVCDMGAYEWQWESFIPLILK